MPATARWLDRLGLGDGVTLALGLVVGYLTATALGFELALVVAAAGAALFSVAVWGGDSVATGPRFLAGFAFAGSALLFAGALVLVVVGIVTGGAASAGAAAGAALLFLVAALYLLTPLVLGLGDFAALGAAVAVGKQLVASLAVVTVAAAALGAVPGGPLGLLVATAGTIGRLVSAGALAAHGWLLALALAATIAVPDALAHLRELTLVSREVVAPERLDRVRGATVPIAGVWALLLGLLLAPRGVPVVGAVGTGYAGLLAALATGVARPVTIAVFLVVVLCWLAVRGLSVIGRNQLGAMVNRFAPSAVLVVLVPGALVFGGTGTGRRVTATFLSGTVGAGTAALLALTLAIATLPVGLWLVGRARQWGAVTGRRGFAGLCSAFFFAGAITAGIAGGAPGAVFPALAGSILVWDLQEHAIGLRAQVGAAGDRTIPQLTHGIVSLVVAFVAIFVAHLTFLSGAVLRMPEDLRSLVLVPVLGGIVLILLWLRPG